MDVLSRIFAWLSDHEAGISAVAAMIVIAGVVFAGFRWLVSRRSQTTPESGTKTGSEEDPLLALPTGPVVAVLPFENLSRDPDQEYFSDGLTDDIITALSRFKDLFVIARNSTFRYKGQAVDVRQLNKELGARYVLEGSVQRSGDALRVTAQLLDAKDGTHLWAETYDRELLDAYECVLQAQVYYRDNVVPPEHAKVRDALERAVKSDPNYMEAWAWLSNIYLDEYRYNFNPRPNSLDRALDAGRRAVASDPTRQDAHHALAAVHFYRHELDAFFAEAERAIALNPNNAAVLAALSTYLQFVGDERGIAFVRKATRLDPFHPTWFYFTIADYHFHRGEYEEALAAARKINLPGLAGSHFYLVAIYAELGRQGDARSALEELLRLNPGFTIEKLIHERRKWNARDDAIRRWVAALRKAGLPE
jgi:adenylate cyclase